MSLQVADRGVGACAMLDSERSLALGLLALGLKVLPHQGARTLKYAPSSKYAPTLKNAPSSKYAPNSKYAPRPPLLRREPIPPNSVFSSRNFRCWRVSL